MLMSSQKIRPSIYSECLRTNHNVSHTLTSCPTNSVCLHDGLGHSLGMHSTHTQLYRTGNGSLLLGYSRNSILSRCIVLALALLYPQRESHTRLSILYSGNIFATSFSGLIAEATFATLGGHHGLAGWKWLFIIEGELRLKNGNDWRSTNGLSQVP